MLEEKLVNTIQRIFFWKFFLLSAVALTLTVGKPAVSAAHKGTQQICALVMDAGECSKHC